MMPTFDEPEVVERAREAARGCDRPLLLAVSGGLDSMSLLDAMHVAAPDRIAAVATFDHASGPHSRQAVAHVRAEARRRGLECVTARMAAGGDRREGLEAMWRGARHRFLRDAAAQRGARVVTAHTQDDQIETVLLRVLRGAGARGLAGLAASGPILRPFLTTNRATLERYAATRGLDWMEDPSNARLDLLRNRVRREILPAMRAADPTLPESLLATGARAATWRAEVESLVDAALPFRRPDSETLVIVATELAAYDADSLSVLWAVLAGRLGLALDRRGTRRCVSFTMKRPRHGAIPLAGGWRLEAVRGELVLSRSGVHEAADARLPDAGTMEWGSFRFAVGEGEDDDRWSAFLSDAEPVVVRRWRAGDRLAPSRGQGPRRVTRYFAEAGIAGSARAGWPVVVQGEEIVWIPGVRRSDAATARSGRPARRYLCERAHS